jgi:hypothetical protein
LELISHKQFLSHFLSVPTGALQLAPGQGSFKNLNGLNVNVTDSIYFEKRCKIKDLIVNIFSFLKTNMTPGKNVPPAI